MEDATLYSLTSRLELVYLIEELFRVVPFLQPYLKYIHIITGPTKSPRVLARVNVPNKSERLVIGKKQIKNIWNPREFEPRKCSKLDNTTANVLK